MECGGMFVLQLKCYYHRNLMRSLDLVQNLFLEMEKNKNLLHLLTKEKRVDKGQKYLELSQIRVSEEIFHIKEAQKKLISDIKTVIMKNL